MKLDIVTFGSGVVDVFVNTDVPEKNNSISYTIGSKILIKDIRFDIGGGGTNTAVAFSRLGLKTGWIGKVGSDNNGKEILDLIKRERIKFLGKIDKGKKTGYSIILDSREKDRTILTFKGVNNDIGMKDLKWWIRTRWLYFSSLLGKSFETQKILAEKLFKKKTKIVFNPSEYLIKRKNLKSLLKITEVLILNKEEAEMLFKKSKIKNKNLLNGLSALGPKVIVVTDKNKKILAYDSRKNKSYSLMPNKVNVVERTGAGDAFASGFTAGIISNKSVPESLKLGLRESESVIRHFGAKNNLLRMNLK